MIHLCPGNSYPKKSLRRIVNVVCGKGLVRISAII